MVTVSGDTKQGLSSQVETRWQTVLGSDGDELPRGFRALDEGGWLVWGAIRAKGAQHTDGWLAAVDAQGRFRWQRTWGGAKDDELVDVQPMADGWILLGNTESFGAGKSDYWLLRTDAWGHNTCQEAGKCAGAAPNHCDDGDRCTADSCDGTKGCLHAFDPSLCAASVSCPVLGDKLLFDKSIDVKSKTEALLGVAPLAGGGAAHVGHTEAKGAGKQEAWLMAWDAAGRLVADRTWGGPEDDAFEHAAAHPGGGLVAAGWTTSKVFGGGGAGDGLLARIDADGSLRWARGYGGEDAERLHGVAVDPQGGIAAAGRTMTGSAGSWVAGCCELMATAWQSGRPPPAARTSMCSKT